MGGIIVVADTHFGIKKDSISMPGYFADFLKWVKKLEEENENVKFLDKNNIAEKTLKNPEKIILLGDIIELWDSDDEAVSACVSTLIPTLAEIGTEKIYVLGNHDNILEKVLLPQKKEYYPLGKSNLKLVEDVYPSDKFLTMSDQNYVFVHGYQFDKHFMDIGKLYNILPALRKLSNSLTDYVPILFILSAIVRTINWVWDTSIFFGKDQIFTLLLLLTLPKIYMRFARPLWNHFSGVKYKKQETIESFTKWWKKFIKNKEIPENLNVVYGHTHFLNYIPAKKIDSKMYEFYMDKLRDRKIPAEKRPALVNISAWIKDIKKKEKDEKYKNVMVASFLYIDEQGFEFFGWDWYEHKIFHIPKIAINERREKGLVDENTARVLKDLGWPEKLIKKWQKSVEI